MTESGVGETLFSVAAYTHRADLASATHTHITRAGTHNWSQHGALPHIT